MKSEIERYKEAVELAITELFALATLGGITSIGNVQAKEALAKINAVLDPPVEMEEVEIERFVIFYSDASTSHMLTREGLQGFDCKGGTVKRIAHTLTRPKPVPVERSITVDAKLHDGGAVVETLTGAVFRSHREAYGKTGKLTFTWTE